MTPDTYYPEPRLAEACVLPSWDWSARDLPGGDQVFAFHPIDWQSYALSQALRTDKSTSSTVAHLLGVSVTFVDH